jgi:murein DD-endopeptidase MepM/ murein hydrolase activator NlpD
VADKAKYVTLMLIPDGAEARRGFRMRYWMLKTLVGLQIALIVGIILFFSFYGQVLSRAAMADKLKDENQRLLRYQYKVKLLEENLKQTREIVTRVSDLAGIDIQFPAVPDDSTLFASLDQPVGATLEREPGYSLTQPSGLPANGFVTQDFDTTEQHFHPGIDIACAVGTPVLATADGTVTFSDWDDTYGHMVVIQHNDSIVTVYGHNDSNLVKVGQHVTTGMRIALSGNTGISTAPHVHYEIRIHNKPINPLDVSHEIQQH